MSKKKLSALQLSLCVLAVCGSLVSPQADKDGALAEAELQNESKCIAAVSDPVLVACTMDGTVYAIEPSSGTIRWAFSSGGPVLSLKSQPFKGSASTSENPGFPSGDAQVLVPGLDGSLFLMIDDHLQTLGVRAQELVGQSPFTAQDGIIILGQKSTQLFGFERRSGQLRYAYSSSSGHWRDEEVDVRQQCPDGMSALEGQDALSVAKVLYSIRAVDTRTGLERWNMTFGDYVSSPFVASEFSQEDDSSPLSPLHLVTTTGSDLVAIDDAQGGVSWQQQLSSPVVRCFLVLPHSTVLTAVRIRRHVGVLLADVTVDGDLDDLGRDLFLLHDYGGQLFVTPTDDLSSPLHPSILNMLVDSLPSDPHSTALLPALPTATPPSHVLRCLPARPLLDASDDSQRALAPPVPPKPPPPRLVNAYLPPSALYTTSSETDPHSALIPALESFAWGAVLSRVLLAAPLSALMMCAMALVLVVLLFVRAMYMRRKSTASTTPPLILAPAVDPHPNRQPNPAPASAAKRKAKKKGGKGGTGDGTEADKDRDEEKQNGTLNGGSRVPHAPSNMHVADAVPATIGRLKVFNEILGRGSHGTVVFAGEFDSRRVAVKRMLTEFYSSAQKEISLLIESDQHPNVLRYFAMEEDKQFIYLVLEHCPRTLSDYVDQFAEQQRVLDEKCRLEEGFTTVSGGGKAKAGVQHSAKIRQPSEEMKELLHGVMAGIAHLHGLNIVHRDIKPANVLLTHSLVSKISDMGLSKKLQAHQTSYESVIPGSCGWQPPEVISNQRLTKAVDVFSAGCLLYYVVTNGRHPFGDRYERDVRIMRGDCDLQAIRHLADAHHLIASMLQTSADNRPALDEVLEHPFFWSEQKRLNFLVDVSDCIEPDDPSSPLIMALEAQADAIMERDWINRLHGELVTNLGKYRKYSTDSVRDLLRVVRNKKHHFRDMPPSLQTSMGPLPSGYLRYFLHRFPQLLIRVYHVVRSHCSSDPHLVPYFPPHTRT